MQNELTAERIELAIKEIADVGMYGSQVHQETMETALAALRAEQERQWISVEDRLPMNNKPVRVYMPKLYMNIQTAFYDRYYGEDDGEWYEQWISNGDVTHWRELPQPPEKKGKWPCRDILMLMPEGD